MADFVDVQELAREIDKRLLAFADERIAMARTVDPSYERLWQAIRELLAAGGKRLRPYMVVLGYQLYSDIREDYERIMSVAMGQELLHVALLIHDDIMDEALVRHGAANVAGIYMERYRNTHAQSVTVSLSAASVRRHADAAALLAGDVLLVTAQGLILDADIAPERRRKLRLLFEKAMFDVTGGQLLDMEAGQPLGYPVPAKAIALHKTASYSFVGPLRSGAVAAGADDAALEALEAFGTTLGLAYQLADDLEGVFGNSDKMGKSTFSDLRDGKRTLLVEIAQDRANDEQNAIFEQYFGKPDLDEAGAERLREVLVLTGAKEMAETVLEQYYQQALAQVQAFEAPISAEGRHTLDALVRLILKRKS